MIKQQGIMKDYKYTTSAGWNALLSDLLWTLVANNMDNYTETKTSCVCI